MMLRCPECQNPIEFSHGINTCQFCGLKFHLKPVVPNDKSGTLLEGYGKTSPSAGDKILVFWTGKTILAIAGIFGTALGAVVARDISSKTIFGLATLIGVVYLIRAIFKIAFKPLDRNLERYVKHKSDNLEQ